MMKFSVLIATRNRPDDLVPCLKSVLAMEHGDFEVVVLDQSTSAVSEEAVREALGAPEHLRYIRSDSKGKSAALNLLFEAACGELWAFTDDDCQVPSDWLTRIEHAFTVSPEAGIVFGQVTPGTSNTEGEHKYTPAFYFKDRRFLKTGEIAGMGANMAIRREVAAKVGCFDTQVGPGTPIPAAEEGDWVYRAQLSGVPILLDPEVKLIHLSWRDWDEWNRVLYGYGMGDAAFALKHTRCGDWRMLKPLFGRPSYIFARLCHRLIFRRQHQEEHYLRGYWKGFWLSLRMRVDPRTRLFVSPK